MFAFFAVEAPATAVLDQVQSAFSTLAGTQWVVREMRRGKLSLIHLTEPIDPDLSFWPQAFRRIERAAAVGLARALKAKVWAVSVAREYRYYDEVFAAAYDAKGRKLWGEQVTTSTIDAALRKAGLPTDEDDPRFERNEAKVAAFVAAQYRAPLQKLERELGVRLFAAKALEWKDEVFARPGTDVEIGRPAAKLDEVNLSEQLRAAVDKRSKGRGTLYGAVLLWRSVGSRVTLSLRLGSERALDTFLRKHPLFKRAGLRALGDKIARYRFAAWEPAVELEGEFDAGQLPLLADTLREAIGNARTVVGFAAHDEGGVGPQLDGVTRANAQLLKKETAYRALEDEMAKLPLKSRVELAALDCSKDLTQLDFLAAETLEKELARAIPVIVPALEKASTDAAFAALIGIFTNYGVRPKLKTLKVDPEVTRRLQRLLRKSSSTQRRWRLAEALNLLAPAQFPPPQFGPKSVVLNLANYL